MHACMDVRMAHASSPSEPVNASTQRRETIVAGVCAVLGFIGIVVAHGGIGSMIAGSVGSVGGGCVAVGLTFLDGRLSYGQRVQASLPIVLMLVAAGIGIQGNALALGGYPLLLLGIAGLVPALTRWMKANSAAEAGLERLTPGPSTSSPVLSNS